MEKKAIEELYLGKDYNCAETTLRVLDGKYGLGIDEDGLKMVGGFGGGMGCGKTCGILCASIVALSKQMIIERSHENPAVRETCAALVAEFENQLGSTECADLKARYFHKDDGMRCLVTVEKGIAVAEGFLKEKKE